MGVRFALPPHTMRFWRKSNTKVTEDHRIEVPEELLDEKLPHMGTQERWAYHRRLRDWHQGELDRSRDALRVQVGR